MTERTRGQQNIDTFALQFLAMPVRWREPELLKLEVSFRDMIHACRPEATPARCAQNAAEMVAQVRSRLAQIVASSGTGNDTGGLPVRAS